MEYRSSALLCDFIERNGFSVDKGVGGVPTSFIARISNGVGPKVGFLIEYDALPGLYNDAVPFRQGNRRLPGHGCGHNHIGPANTGAGIAAAKALVELNLGGEIVLIGCPAEEILWGKLALQAAGIFDGLDVILTSHGDYQNGALARPCHAMAMGEFKFEGESAHGGISTAPNALEAAEAAYAKFDQVTSSISGLQLKHVFRHAGISPGVTPEEVRLWTSLRHPDFEGVRQGYQLMQETFSWVAAERGVAIQPEQIAICRGYLGNDTVGRVLDGSLKEVGPPRWTVADIDWMRQLSAACSPGKPFKLHSEIGYFDSGIDYYGQDDGDISWQVPLGRVNWAYPENVPIHHWAWTALSGHSASSPGPLMASEALALAATTLIQSPQIVLAAQAELAQKIKGQSIRKPSPTISDVLVRNPQSFWDATWER